MSGSLRWVGLLVVRVLGIQALGMARSTWRPPAYGAGWMPETRELPPFPVSCPLIPSVPRDEVDDVHERLAASEPAQILGVDLRDAPVDVDAAAAEVLCKQ